MDETFDFREKITGLVFVISITTLLMFILYFIIYAILNYMGIESNRSVFFRNIVLSVFFLIISYISYSKSRDLIKESLLTHPRKSNFSGDSLKEFILFSLLDMFPIISIWVLIFPVCIILSHTIDKYIIYNTEGGILLTFILIFISFKAVDILYYNYVVGLLKNYYQKG
jgi:hypothetical protein